MKRIIGKITLIVVAVAMAFSMAACGGRSCDICEDSGARSRTIMGSNIDLCSDCYEGMSPLNNLGNLF